MSVLPLDESRLDDPDALDTVDRSGMLPAVATAAAQVRSAATAAADAGVGRVADAGRPRAVVVAGMGGSAIAGDVLAAITGSSCAIPVVVHRDYGLPGWVGVADLVIAVSCSGRTEETLSAADEAARRGCRLLSVGAGESPLADVAQRARGVHVAVPGGRPPRSNLWALATPLVVAADALGLVAAPPAVLNTTADRLERIAIACRPATESFANPAKDLALQLAGTLPLVWGTSGVAGVSAYRLGCQLAENAKSLAVTGVLPEAHHNQIVAFDGSWAGEDLFRDPVEDPGPVRLRLVLLRDATEHPRLAARVDQSRELAAERGIAVTELSADGGSAYERLASLVGLLDYATVYLALLLGVDPTPIAPIDALKARIAS